MRIRGTALADDYLTQGRFACQKLPRSSTKIGVGFGLWRLGMPSPDTICSYAERAEALGIDSIWLSDHIVSRNPELEISCIMAMLKTLSGGRAKLMRPTRSSMVNLMLWYLSVIKVLSSKFQVPSSKRETAFNLELGT